MKDAIKIMHTIYVDEKKCSGRMACMRNCPTNAIIIKNKKAKIIEELCIDCGECIKVCPNNAIKPFANSFGDLKTIGTAIGIVSPVLYSQFKIGIKPELIIEGLKRIGFDEVYDISKYCVVVRKAIEKFIEASKGSRPIISSHCPAIVSLIEIEFPSLIEHLLPIKEPREIAAMDIRKNLKQKNATIFYITPCSSKLIDVKMPRWKEKSFIDGAIPISDIYNPLISAILDIKHIELERLPIYPEGIEWAAEGGIIKYLKPTINSLSSSGIVNAKKLLSDIEANKLREIDFVEILACDRGCIGGSLTIENTYLAINKIKHLISELPRLGEETIGEKDYTLEREWLGIKGKSSVPSDLHKAILRIKEKEKINSLLPQFDCGLCGYPKCEIFAEYVAKGESSLNECIFEELKKIDKSLNEIFQKWEIL